MIVYWIPFRAFARMASATFVVVLLSPQVLPQVSTPDSRWTVLFAEDPGLSFKRTECHPLQYFLANIKNFTNVFPQTWTPDQDQTSARRVGKIDGFEIYDVIHHFQEDDLDIVLKIVLVERRLGEFCEIYESGGVIEEITVEPSYIQAVGTNKVLVSRDPVSGTGGIVEQAYWTFDKAGPIPIDFFSLITATIHSLLPEGTDEYTSMDFNIRTMVYDSEVWRQGDSHAEPSGGHITIRFGFKGHRPVVIGTKVTPHSQR